MNLLYLASSVANIILAIVLGVYLRRIDKLEKKLAYTEACLERADENNRRMLVVIDEANR